MHVYCDTLTSQKVEPACKRVCHQLCYEMAMITLSSDNNHYNESRPVVGDTFCG